jgi:hypothetical protein
VVPQLPRATEKIDVGMTVEIEVSEVRNRLVGPTGRNVTAPHETSKALQDLDIDEVRRVQLVLFPEEVRLYSFAERCLQQ